MQAQKRIRAGIAAPLALLVTAGCATTGGEAPQVRAVKAPAANAAPSFTQKDVLGRDASALDKLFGPAALVRREGEGEFRRYALAGCALIVILYPDEAGRSAARRLDAAAKTSGETPPDLDQCLARGIEEPAAQS